MNKHINTGLRVLNQLIAAIPQTTGIIAGGAVRDSILKRDIKDVDIFLSSFQYSAEDLGQLVHDQLIKLDYAVERFDQRAETQDRYDDGANYTLRFELDGIQIEVVPVEDIQDKFNGFPDSISRAYVNPTGTVVTSKEFNESVIHSYVLFRENLAEARVQRLEKKFPEFRFYPSDGFPPPADELEDLLLD